MEFTYPVVIFRNTDKRYASFSPDLSVYARPARTYEKAVEAWRGAACSYLVELMGGGGEPPKATDFHEVTFTADMIDPAVVEIDLDLAAYKQRVADEEVAAMVSVMMLTTTM